MLILRNHVSDRGTRNLTAFRILLYVNDLMNAQAAIVYLAVSGVGWVQIKPTDV